MENIPLQHQWYFTNELEADDEDDIEDDMDDDIEEDVLPDLPEFKDSDDFEGTDAEDEE